MSRSYAQRFPVPPWRYRCRKALKGAGGMSRMVDFSARSWGGLGRSWRIFWLIFSPSFFTLIFYWFYLDFGGGLGGFWEGKMVKKFRFWMFFGVCLWKPYFSWIFAWSSFKTMAKNIWDFHCFWIRCCLICLLDLLFSVILETLKIVIFPRENTYFYKIPFFAFDVQRCRKLV